MQHACRVTWILTCERLDSIQSGKKRSSVHLGLVLGLVLSTHCSQRNVIALYRLEEREAERGRQKERPSKCKRKKEGRGCLLILGQTRAMCYYLPPQTRTHTHTHTHTHTNTQGYRTRISRIKTFGRLFIKPNMCEVPVLDYSLHNVICSESVATVQCSEDAFPFRHLQI